MMKYNRQAWWILLLILFVLVMHIIQAGRILPGFGTFLVIVLLGGTASLLWDNYYLSSLENTLHKFSDAHNGTVKFIEISEDNEAICCYSRGNYFGRAFYINTEVIRRGKSHYHRMTVHLKMNSPVRVSLELKRKRWGKVELDPLSIADVYNIQTTLPRTAPGLPNLYNSPRFKEDFISLIDQQKLRVKLAKIGKKHRDDLNQFNLFADGRNIGVRRCVPIRSIDDLENFVNVLQEMAEIIEGLYKKYS